MHRRISKTQNIPVVSNTGPVPCFASSDSTLTGLGDNILWDRVGTKWSSLALAQGGLGAFGLSCALDSALGRVGGFGDHAPTWVHEPQLEL